MRRRKFVKGVLAGAVAGFPAAALSQGKDPREFGATGDGKADDTAALQRAVDADEGVISLSRGTYRLTAPVVADLGKLDRFALFGGGVARVVMEGSGPAFLIRGHHDGTANPSSFDASVWDRERLPLVSGLEIRGASEGAVGLRLEGTMQATLTSVQIRRCRVGMHLTGRNRNLVVSHCHVYHNRETGILLDSVNLHQAIIADSHVSYNLRSGIEVRGGEVRNLQIVGNDVEYNHDPEREGSADIFFDSRPEGSSFREGTIVGNTIQALPSPLGANIRILGGQGRNVGGLLAITGNLIGSQNDALHLVDCRGVSITGNFLYSSARQSLRAERSANVTFADNSIDWNPGHRTKGFSDGIFLRDCDGVTLSGVILENCFQGTLASGGAIEVHGSRDITVTGCQLLDPRHRGIVLVDSRRCRIVGTNVVERRAGRTLRAAIEVSGSSRDNLISGCTFPRDSLQLAEGAAVVSGNLELEG